jgi:hypothetical protein
MGAGGGVGGWGRGGVGWGGGGLRCFAAGGSPCPKKIKALPGWDAAAERRDAQDELHSAAQ